MTFQSQPLHLLVKRNAWEPKHEWESRLLFVEEHLDQYGLEKAINLSLVWANVNFLGCSYPSHTHELVSGYPLPDQEALRMERKKRERVQRKRPSSGGDKGEGEDEKRVRTTQNESEDTLSSDAAHNSSAEDTDTSFEHVSLQVDALISAIRKQHEKKAAEEKKNRDDGTNLPQEVLKMLRAMCMCNQCFCPGTSPSSQVNSIIQRYVARFDKNFNYDFGFQEDRGITDCRFLINGQLITKGRDANRKIANQKAAEQFVQLVNGYYKIHGKQCCPHKQGRR